LPEEIASIVGLEIERTCLATYIDDLYNIKSFCSLCALVWYGLSANAPCRTRVLSGDMFGIAGILFVHPRERKPASAMHLMDPIA
jgi:hypothetical protein